MWAIRILNGPQAGQIYPLRPGKNILGRAPTCEVKLAHNGISKEHAQIYVTEDKLIVSDMNSRNGTFVNGIRIQNQRVSSGDKINLHELIFDLVQVPEHAMIGGFPRPMIATTASPPVMQNPMYPQMEQYQQPVEMIDEGQPVPAEPMSPQRAPGLVGMYESAVEYIETVAMPAVYRFARMAEYRWVLAGFVGLYITLVTLVSVLPTLSLVESSIQDESIRRSQTIARNLAAFNRQPIIEKNEMSVSVRMAEIEDGVSAAMIISAKDGSIIAPANLRGSYTDKAFVSRARKADEELAEKISDSSIGASAPIVGFNADTNMNTTLAYAIVLYDMSVVVSEQGRVIRLFTQIFAISLVLGLILYFFLIRVVEKPIDDLNAQLDAALREGRDDLLVDFKYPRLQALAANISSALARISNDGGHAAPVFVNRDLEATHLLAMINSAAIAINAVDGRIILTNPAFDRLVGGGVDLRGRSLGEIPDTALQSNLRDLVPILRGAPDQPAIGELPFMGEPHQVVGKTIVGASGEPAYYIICIRKPGYEEAA